MTFPIVTTVLDAFTRADATTAGAGWSQVMASGVKNFGISSNKLYNPDNAFQLMAWNAATYGPDCEVWVTLSTLPLVETTLYLCARLKEITVDAWTFDGYTIGLWRWDDAGTDTMSMVITRLDNGAGTELGAWVDVPNCANGDRFGGRFQRSELKCFYDDGSGYVERIARTDATYAAAGYLAIYTEESTSRLDDFGGGTLVTCMPKGTMYYKRMRGEA